MARQQGFTLAELLISLGILSVIATFTIPKVLTSQQSAQKNAMTKEYASVVSQAFQLYKAEHSDNVSVMHAKDLMSYINYVKSVTDWSYMDNAPGSDYVICTATNPCLKFANGAMLYLDGTLFFNGTNTTNALPFHFDPDGTYQGGTSGPGKGVMLILYYNGRITSYERMASNTCIQLYGCLSPTAGLDPTWMIW